MILGGLQKFVLVHAYLSYSYTIDSRRKGAHPVHELFDHEHLDVYRVAIDYVAWGEPVCDAIRKSVAARDHMMRAGAGIPTSIAQATGVSSQKERRQSLDTAYGSTLECAACLDVLSALGHLSEDTAGEGKAQLVRIVSMLVRYRKKETMQVSEASVSYGRAPPARFDHEDLHVYQRALEFVAWFGGFSREPSVRRSTSMALDKAATGVALHIAEGNGKFSTADRGRFIEYARVAALRAAAQLDVAVARAAELRPRVGGGKNLLAECVRMLVAWRKSIGA